MNIKQTCSANGEIPQKVREFSGEVSPPIGYKIKFARVSKNTARSRHWVNGYSPPPRQIKFTAKLLSQLSDGFKEFKLSNKDLSPSDIVRMDSIVEFKN
ncbi:MAG: hypothetical protein ACLUKN_13860 [Bacilli bacterium]